MAISVELVTFTVSILSLLAAVGSAVYAGRSNAVAQAALRTSEVALQYQVLLPTLFEYRTADMLMAIRSLWSFAREHPSDLEVAFATRRAKDYAELEQMEPTKRSDHLRTTLDYKRRIVSQFYGILTSVHQQGGLQRKFIYTHWSKSDLQIIPDVLIPMEKCVAGMSSTQTSPTLDRLRTLYDDCPQ